MRRCQLFLQLIETLNVQISVEVLECSQHLPLYAVHQVAGGVPVSAGPGMGEGRRHGGGAS